MNLVEQQIQRFNKNSVAYRSRESFQTVRFKRRELSLEQPSDSLPNNPVLHTIDLTTLISLDY